MSNKQTALVLSNRVYDFGKSLVQIVLPALSSLYFGLANIWGLPRAEQVVGTLAVIATFIGMLLGVSSKVYSSSGLAYDGNVLVYSPEEGKKLISLELNMDPEEIENLDSIKFKVVPSSEAILDESDDFAN